MVYACRSSTVNKAGQSLSVTSFRARHPPRSFATTECNFALLPLSLSLAPNRSGALSVRSDPKKSFDALHRSSVLMPCWVERS